MPVWRAMQEWTCQLCVTPKTAGPATTPNDPMPAEAPINPAARPISFGGNQIPIMPDIVQKAKPAQHPWMIRAVRMAV